MGRSLIKGYYVKPGGSVEPPQAPSHTGYDFKGWSTNEYTKVTRDIDVDAQYSLKTFTITFINDYNKVQTTQTVTYGSSAVMPNSTTFPDLIPTRTGYDFNWSPSTISNVRSNQTVHGNYTVSSGYVWIKFYKLDKTTVILLSLVAKGSNVTPPTPLYDSTKYVFGGWDKDTTNVLSNLDVYMKLTEKSTTVKFDTKNNGTFNVKASVLNGVIDLNNSKQAEAIAKSLNKKVSKSIKLTLAITDTSYTITSIGSLCFKKSDYKYIKSVSLPVCKTISTLAFYGSNIESVVLPELTTIKDEAFSKSKISTVNLPKVTTVAAKAFKSCTKLGAVTLSACTTIGSEAFCESSTLTLDIRSATTIGTNALMFNKSSSTDVIVSQAIYNTITQSNNYGIDRNAPKSCTYNDTGTEKTFTMKNTTGSIVVTVTHP